MPLEWVSLIVGIALFLIGIPVAYFVGRRNRQVPDLRIATDFDRIVEPGDWLLQGDLKVVFDGVPLSRVSRTYVAMWNHRGDTVRATDILSSDPLRIFVEDDDEVLRARVVASSRRQIAARVEGEGALALVEFDFLDRGDGFVIEVLHRGTQPAVLQGTLPGTTWGAPKTAALTRGARAMARKPWIARFASMFTRGFSRAAVLVLGLIGVVTFGYIGVNNFIRWMTPEIVSIQNFDLDTLEGQREFATAVTKGGNVDTITGWTNLIYLATAALFVAIFYVSTRTAVPRSILAEESAPSDGDVGLEARPAQRPPASDESSI